MIRLISKLIFCLALLSTQCVSVDPNSYAKQIPERPDNAMTGSVFIQKSNALTSEQREKIILRELRLGNIPSFLRQLVPVHATHKANTGEVISATFYVMPDFLAIGSDKDFVRLPMTTKTAQAIADMYGYILPTPKMVDLIQQQADVALDPTPLPPSQRDQSTGYIFSHQFKIEGQLNPEHRDHLIAGHKMSLVVSKHLESNPEVPRFYGWPSNDDSKTPAAATTSPVSYSQGVRLVASMMTVDEELRLVDTVLKNYRLAPLLSYDGALRKTRY